MTQRNGKLAVPTQAGARTRARRWALALLCGLTAMSLAGCEDTAVSSYRVAKEGQDAKPEKAPAARLIAITFERPQRSFYVKLLGPAQLASRSEAQFEKFLSSIRWTDNPDVPMEWTVPEGWQLVPTSNEKIRAIGGERHALFHVGTKEEHLEVDITSFPGKGGDAILNVNRWRSQVRLPPITAPELDGAIVKQKINDLPVTRVDLTGELVKK
jgi:hypothetical protein